MADDLTLLFWILDPLQSVKETGACIYYSQGDSKVFTEVLLDLLALVETQKTVVDELFGYLLVPSTERRTGENTYHSMETIADGFGHELCRNSRVDATLLQSDQLDS